MSTSWRFVCDAWLNLAKLYGVPTLVDYSSSIHVPSANLSVWFSCVSIGSSSYTTCPTYYGILLMAEDSTSDV